MEFVRINFGTEDKPKIKDLAFKVPSMKVKIELSKIEEKYAEFLKTKTAEVRNVANLDKTSEADQLKVLEQLPENTMATNAIEQFSDLLIIDGIKVISNTSKLTESELELFNSDSDSDFWMMQDISELTESRLDFFGKLKKTTILQPKF